MDYKQLVKDSNFSSASEEPVSPKRLRKALDDKQKAAIRDSVTKIVDGIVQRSIHAAIAMIESTGISHDKAASFVSDVINRIPSLKDSMKMYIRGIIRWYVEGSVDLSSDEELSRINTLLRGLAVSPARDALNANFYSDISESLLSLEEVKDLVGVDIDSRLESFDSNHTYEVKKISEFKDLEDYLKYVNNWCISVPEVFEKYTMNGKNTMYLCLRDDYASVKPIPGDETPYDDYGLSIISVIVDMNSEIASVTSRWNVSLEADNFLSKEDLKELLGSSYSKLSLS